LDRLSPLNEKLVATVNKNQEFKVGDLVEAFGLFGEVVRIEYASRYPVEVRYQNDSIEIFCADGKAEKWHKIPSLKLISRPQKTEKKKVWVKAYEQNPAAGHEEPRYIPVQIEAEVTVEE